MANAKYYYNTEDILSKFKPSLSNYFAVSIEESIDFYAYEAVIPGSSYETTQVFGDIQGLTQTFANKRVYPPVDISFYVDYDYQILNYFEVWMSKISIPFSESTSFSKFRYPSGYKKNITIIKFEKEFRTPGNRLKKGGSIEESKNQAKYTLVNAYPVNLISLPVSYENSGLLRTTVTFNYDRYDYKHYSPGGQLRQTPYLNQTLSSNTRADSTREGSQQKELNLKEVNRYAQQSNLNMLEEQAYRELNK